MTWLSADMALKPCLTHVFVCRFKLLAGELNQEIAQDFVNISANDSKCDDVTELAEGVGELEVVKPPLASKVSDNQ